jgi:hypothetical protein
MKLLYRYMKQILGFLFFGMLLACNSDETSKDALTELKRLYSPDGSKYILFYQYVTEVQDTNTSLIIVVHKDEEVDLRKQSYFSNIDLDTIYWLNNDTIVAVEKFMNFLVKGRSNYKETHYPMNGAIVKIGLVDPVDSTFRREDLFRQRSPDRRTEVEVYRYVHPQGRYAILNVSVIDAGNKAGKYGNFFVGRSDFDCIRDIRWDSIGDFTIQASRECYYGFEEYLNKNRPAIKYKLILSEEKGNTFFKQVTDTTWHDTITNNQ